MKILKNIVEGIFIGVGGFLVMLFVLPFIDLDTDYSDSEY